MQSHPHSSTYPGWFSSLRKRNPLGKMEETQPCLLGFTLLWVSSYSLNGCFQLKLLSAYSKAGIVQMLPCVIFTHPLSNPLA